MSNQEKNSYQKEYLTGEIIYQIMEYKVGENDRNSTIELLRIICIVIIILHHFCVHGILLLPSTAVTVDVHSWQLLATQFLGWGGPMANLVFILITGYFMIERKVNYKRILLLVAALFFYAWIIAAVFYGFHLRPWSFDEIQAAMVPIWFGYNWFVCCYVILFLFIPFLNLFLNKLSQSQYMELLLLTLFLYGIVPTFQGETFMNASLIEFVFMYSIGGYIHLFGFKKNTSCFWYRITALCTLILLMSILCFNIIGHNILEIDKTIIKCWQFAPLFSIFIATALFMSFLTMESFVNPFINHIAKSVLGIYLIHDNPIIREFIWKQWLPNINYIGSGYFLVFMLLKIITVFIICLIIDQLRIYFVEKPLKAIIDKHWDNWSKICTYHKQIIINKIVNYH